MVREGSVDAAAAAAAASVAAAAAVPVPADGDWCHVSITGEPLDAGAAIAYVTAPCAGGISVFLGTTRDSFEGRVVTRLEYEAYEPMALRELRAIAGEARGRWDIHRVAVAHRTGVVPVAQASVVIAVSSAHRGAGLDAVRYIIDALKARVPIWKREVYAGDEGVWKENREFHAWAAGAGAGAAPTAAESVVASAPPPPPSY
jgi:molybdopterin synthase catalytic subunit